MPLKKDLRPTAYQRRILQIMGLRALVLTLFVITTIWLHTALIALNCGVNSEAPMTSELCSAATDRFSYMWLQMWYLSGVMALVPVGLATCATMTVIYVMAGNKLRLRGERMNPWRRDRFMGVMFGSGMVALAVATFLAAAELLS